MKVLPWDKNAYEEECYRLADGYISGATRFGKVDLEKIRSDSAFRTIKINLSCKRYSVVNESELKGEVDAEEKDLATDDPKLYDLVVKKMFDDEVGNIEISELFLREIKKLKYGEFQEKQHYCSHTNRAVLKEVCNSCNGCGTKICANCGGKGVSVCKVCHGSMQQTCTHCQGRCYVGSHTCPTCGGSAKIGCRGCGGIGSMICVSCSGTGKFECGTCGGKKYLSKTSTVETYIEPSYEGFFSPEYPDYVSSTCRKIGIPNLGSYAHELTLANCKCNCELIELEYLIAIPFCELVVRFHEKEFLLVFAGDKPELFDAGGIVEELVAEDVDVLERHNSMKNGLGRSVRREGAALVSILSQSEVVQNLFDLVKKSGGSFSDLSNGLNNALSPDFIARLLVAVNLPIKADSKVTRINFLLFGAITAAPLSSVFVLNNYFNKPHPFGNFHEGIFETYFLFLAAFSMIYGLMLGAVGIISSRFLITKFGHKSIIQYAKSFGLLLGYKFALSSALICVLATLLVASLFPVKSEVFGRLYLDVGSSEVGKRIYLPNRSAQVGDVVSPGSVDELKSWFRSLCTGSLDTSPEYVEAVLLKFEKSNVDKFAISNSINCLPKSAAKYLPSFDRMLSEGDRAFAKENKRLVTLDENVKLKIFGTWLSTSCKNVNGSQDSQCDQYAGLKVRYNQSEAETILGSGISQKSKFSLSEINVIDGNLLVSPKIGSSWKIISDDRMILRFRNFEFLMKRI